MEGIDTKRVQGRLLEMAKTISVILESNHIEYMIAYGTLLGAVRHEGFIPWDDDFDFYLFDDSYDKAVEVLRKELPEDMFLEDEKSEPLYFHSWAHIKDMNSITECEEFPQDSLYAHRGISVDLYRTKSMQLQDLETYLNDENEKYIMRRRDKKLISEEEYQIRIENLMERRRNVLDNPNSSKRVVYNLVPLYQCHFMKSEDVFPLKKYIFEDCEFWGPNFAENILKDIYGDYMKLPPVEKRRCHYSSVEFIQ